MYIYYNTHIVQTNATEFKLSKRIITAKCYGQRMLKQKGLLNTAAVLSGERWLIIGVHVQGKISVGRRQN